MDALTEIELKYTIPDDAAAQRLLAQTEWGPFRRGPIQQQHLYDRYCDSADHALAAAGYALRVRQAAGMAAVQVKSRSPAGGGHQHQRQEWRVITPTPLQPLLWPISPARNLILAILPDPALLPLFAVAQVRHRAGLWLHDQEIAEWTVDRVSWLVAGRSLTAWEMEIELAPGQSPALLDAVDRYLLAQGQVQPQTDSKFVRGLRLLLAAEVQP